MLRSTMSSSDGTYKFYNVPKGLYVVSYGFDNEKYQLASYKKSGIPEEVNSDAIAIQSEMYNALSNSFYVNENDVNNINLGLQEKDKFDLSVSNTISSINVTSADKTD
jgi:hypothetical protein